MKKLSKRSEVLQETLEAYCSCSCPCTGTCDCSNTDAYAMDYAMYSSFYVDFLTIRSFA